MVLVTLVYGEFVSGLGLKSSLSDIPPGRVIRAVFMCMQSRLVKLQRQNGKQEDTYAFKQTTQQGISSQI